MESLRPILSGLIGALVAALLMRWLARGNQKSVPAGTIRYSPRLRAVSLLMLAVGCFIAYAATHASANQRWIAFLVAAPLLGGSIWFAMEAFFVSAQVSKSALVHRSPWRGTRHIQWPAVTGYEFSQALGCHVLETSEQGTVRLSVYMSGVDQIAEHLAQHSNDA